MERILIVRLGAMGDVLHALPAATALRKRLPGVRLDWAIEERWSELLCARAARAQRQFAAGTRGKPVVDGIIPANTKAWRSALFSDETWREMRLAVSAMRESRYDLTIDVQGSLKSAIVAAASGAGRVVGYSRTREGGAGLFYDRKFEARGAHVVEQANALCEVAAGLDAQPPARPELPVDEAAEEWCDRELSRLGVASFALITPSAGWGAKIWPTERYADVVRGLAKHGLRTVVNAGPGEEKLAESVVQGAPQYSSAVRCSIGELIALTRRCRIFIGGDTGPMHLAAALGKPVVALFGPTDPERNGPYGAPAVVLRHQSSATSYSHRPAPDEGLMAIESQDVIEAARYLLGSVRG
jgi:heptosyltransferase I